MKPHLWDSRERSAPEHRAKSDADRSECDPRRHACQVPRLCYQVDRHARAIDNQADGRSRRDKAVLGEIEPK